LAYFLLTKIVIYDISRVSNLYILANINLGKRRNTMKNLKILFIVGLVVLVVSGCTTSRGQWGSGSGPFLVGAGSADNNDPSRKVDSGQIAARDVGPYGAALGIGSISDPDARTDAKEALETVSANQNNFWGSGGGIGGSRISGRAPTVLGSNKAYGKFLNTFDYPIKVFVKGIGSAHTFGPGQELDMFLPHGKYTLVLYDSQGVKISENEQVDTRRPIRLGDTAYDFYVRLDGR
jgi:hypothetical protein